MSTPSSGPSPDINQVKAKMRATWIAGDFGQIARYTAAEAAAFVERTELKKGWQVLDVACGTGNLSIPAAVMGCKVTGIDIAPNLVEQARQRAEQAEVKAEFLEGDAEKLPFPDNSFDAVITMYGAMFAPRPDVVTNEMLRVTRPGGLIAMANWTPEGFTGDMFKLTAKYVPPPPGIPAPALWGKEDVVKERFGDRVSKLEMVRRRFIFDFHQGPAGVVEFFRTYFGPTQVAFSKLDAEGQEMLRTETEKLWSSRNVGTADHTIVESEYLEVKARKK